MSQIVASFSDSNTSQGIYGSVATRLRWGETITQAFTANLFVSRSMKESENQSTFGEFLARVYSDSLFDSHCTIQQATQQQPRRNKDIGQYDVWAFAVQSSPSCIGVAYART